MSCFFLVAQCEELYFSTHPVEEATNLVNSGTDSPCTLKLDGICKQKDSFYGWL